VTHSEPRIIGYDLMRFRAYDCRYSQATFVDVLDLNEYRAQREGAIALRAPQHLVRVERVEGGLLSREIA